jgi:hypothetical protein
VDQVCPFGLRTVELLGKAPEGVVGERELALRHRADPLGRANGEAALAVVPTVADE